MQNTFSKGQAKSAEKDLGVAIYPCSQEKEYISRNDKGEKQKKRVTIDVYIVISESVFLVLEPDAKKKGIGKLVSWGTLPTIDNIKRTLDNPDYLTISWRKLDDKEPWVLNVNLPNRGDECVHLLTSHLKKQKLQINQIHQKQKKLKESEVTSQSILQSKDVDNLMITIKKQEGLVYAY